MPYSAKDYGKLLGMKGFSDTLLKNHFTLYQGYVTNTNKALDTLAAMLSEGKTGTPEYAEIKRRFGWEFNGMRLHEQYFGNLGGTGALDSSRRRWPPNSAASRNGKPISGRPGRCGGSAG